MWFHLYNEEQKGEIRRDKVYFESDKIVRDRGIQASKDPSDPK
jgi:hypothetical protein